MRNLAILAIRITPMLMVLSVALFYIETLYSINVGNYLDYGEYIVYSTPISDCMGLFFSSTYLMLLMLYILSATYKFCIYHRMFIYYLFVNRLFSDIVGELPISIDYSLIIYISLFITILVLFLTLHLYLKHGDRKLQ